MKKTYNIQDDSGFSYFFTMSFLVILMMLSGAIMNGAIGHSRHAMRQASLEEAFIVAEGGLEHGLQFLVNQGFTPVSIPDGGSFTYTKDNASVTISNVCRFVYKITSVGTINGVSRMVEFGSVSPPGYELFARANTKNKTIWDVPGDEFFGEVYWGDKPFISVHGENIWDTPVYWQDAYMGKDQINGDPNEHTFQKNLIKNTTRTDPNRDIDWDYLKSSAASYGDVLTGNTSLKFNGSQMLVKNFDEYGDNEYHERSIVGDDIIYVQGGISGKVIIEDNGVGNVLDGKLTIIAEGDIFIKEHVRYQSNPALNPSSDDVLGLISKDDIWIDQNAPSNIDVHAAFIAAGVYDENDGSFGVDNYNSISPKGNLNLLGSLVQDVRGAVGTFSRSTGQITRGYSKNYMMDDRFLKTDASGCRFSPPYFPAVQGQVNVGQWREQAQ